LSLARQVLAAISLIAVTATVAGAGPLPPPINKQETVAGGVLQQYWAPGFGVGRIFTPLTLTPADPAYANPSGDHTVAVLTNNDTNLGGIAASATDANGYFDYSWQADFFTGAGDTRRGLIVRADATNGFQTFYQLVINPGLFLIRFRKFVNGNPVVPDLMSWQSPVVLGSLPAQNSWHHMEVDALGNRFTCKFDGITLPGATTATETVDTNSPILVGWVGAYNFSASVGEVPAFFDNLTLGQPFPTATASKTWGQLKKLYR
jgi:hypothetical protein